MSTNTATPARSASPARRLSAKSANRLLWTGQILLAALFLFAGSMKFIMPLDVMQQGPLALPGWFLHFIGVAEIAGALGLVLPDLTRIMPKLTTLAAIGLAIIMIGATTISIVGFGVGAAIVPCVVGTATVLIALGRRDTTKSRHTTIQSRNRSLIAPTKG